jgi:hypothetical protein
MSIIIVPGEVPIHKVLRVLHQGARIVGTTAIGIAGMLTVAALMIIAKDLDLMSRQRLREAVLMMGVVEVGAILLVQALDPQEEAEADQGINFFKNPFYV